MDADEKDALDRRMRLLTNNYSGPFATYAPSITGAAAYAPPPTAGDPNALPQGATPQSALPPVQQNAAPPAPPLNQPPMPGMRQALTPEEMRAMISPVRGMAQREYSGARAEQDSTERQMALNSAGTESGLRTEGQADQRLQELKGQQSAEQNTIDKQAVDMAQQQQDKLQRIQQEAQMATDAQMKRITSAADEASQASVQNFWHDKSTGSRILGVLAQAFSGAANALAGNPSAPTPLDRIIAADLQMQVQNLNQKNQKLQNERGVLKDIYDKTGNAMQATTSMYIAAWKRVDLMSQQLASKFGTPEAQAMAQKTAGIMQQRISSSTDQMLQQLHSQNIQQGEHAMDVLEKEDALDAKAQANAPGAPPQGYHLAGMKGQVSEQVYNKFSADDKAYRRVVAQAEAIQHIFNHGGEHPLAAWEEYSKRRADLFFAIRDLEGVKSRTDPKRDAALEAMLPTLAKNVIPGYAELNDGSKQIANILNTVTRHHFSQLDGTVDGLQLDPTDMAVGRYVSKYMQDTDAERRDKGRINGR